MITPAAAGPPSLPRADHDQAMRDTARELEATFLAEMLKHAGLGAREGAFGGGAGEEQFASFLRLEQARALVDAGGIGLSEQLFEAMKENDDGAV